MSKISFTKALPVLVIFLAALAIFMLRTGGITGGSTGLNLENDMAIPQYGAVYD